MGNAAAKNLFLHIGFHKTGTSAIQSFLSSNAANLKAAGIYYPEIGRSAVDPSHGAFANGFKSINRRMGFKKISFAELLAELELKCTEPLVLLSSECFVEDSAVPEALARDISSFFNHIRYCAVVRTPVSWLESVHAEVVKDPHRRFAGPFELLREYRLGHYDFARRLEPWRQAFGQDNEILIDYDANKKSILDVFLPKIIPSFDNQWLISKQESDARVNQNIGFAATEFLRRINMLPLTIKEHQSVVRHLINLSTNLELKITASPKVRYLPDRLRAEILKLQHVAVAENDSLDHSVEYVPELFAFDHQRDLLAALPADVAKIISDNAFGFLNVDVEKRLLPAPPAKIQDYLIATVIRQRFELRRIYDGPPT